MAQAKKKENVTIDRSGQEITLTVVIPKKKVKEAFDKVKNEAVGNIEVPGFRKGKAPKEVAEKHLDDDAMAQNLYQELIPEAYAKAVSDNDIKPVVPPQINVKSFGKEEELVFEAKTAERPKVKLGDYEKAVRSLKGKVIYGPEGKPIKGEDEVTAAQVLEKLRETVDLEIPHALVDYEVQRMLSSLVDQVQSLGMTVDQYLSSQGKKAKEVQDEYHEVAKRNLKDEFILVEIAQEERIDVSEEEIQQAVEANPDPQTKKNLQTPQGQAYLTDILRKRKTLEHLLNLAGAGGKSEKDKKGKKGKKG